MERLAELGTPREEEMWNITGDFIPGRPLVYDPQQARTLEEPVWNISEEFVPARPLLNDP